MVQKAYWLLVSVLVAATIAVAWDAWRVVHGM
jgi:hypothetical protein